MKKVLGIFCIIATIVLVGLFAYDPFIEGEYKILDVVDGDTVVIEGNEAVRLIGIDAPEKGECFADEAKKYLEEILSENVEIQCDDTQDKRDVYGRLLGYLILSDGTNVNYMMVANGYAREYTHIYPYIYQEDFLNAQEKAKKEKRGFWGVCD